MKETLINFLLDETGSMSNKTDETISGFNEYLDSLKKHGNKVRMTLTKFNTLKTEIVCSNILVKNVPHLNHETYFPNHGTPLLDAVGNSIKSIEKALMGKKQKPEVLCVILTDGEENASQEYTKQAIFDIIIKKEEDGWTFAYLGANQDSWSVGGDLGIYGASTLDWANNSAGVTRAFAMAATTTDTYLRAGSQSTINYFAADKYSEDDVVKFEAKISARVKREKSIKVNFI